MKKLLTILFAVALGLNLSAQVPNYVPTDGLVAWYPFNGNANDESGISDNGELFSVETAPDRFGNDNSAFYFSGSGCTPHIETNINWLDGTEGMSISFWINRVGNGCSYPRIFGFWSGGNGPQSWGMAWSNSATLDYMGTSPANNTWHHVAVTLTSDSIHAYLNGALQNSYVSGKEPPLASYMSIGRMTHPAYDAFNGYLDDFALYNRTLTQAEITALYNAQLPIPGCTDPTACNFNEEANIEDDSCIYPLFGDDCDDGGAACGEGTIWDSSLQSCVGFDQCPSDLNDDGIVGINDLLSLLSDFGTMCPIWMCGDLVNYHGYDYATVQIGDQCWFAENLRTELYQNGDEVPFVEAAAQWSSLTSGARRIYGSGDANCGVEGDTIGYCGEMAESVFALNGYLYNWHTVIDSRSICPGNWHVPNDVELEVLLDEAGNDDQGAISSLKSEEGWSEGNGGSNTSGFNALGSGYGGNLGNFSSDGHFTGFWSADDTGSSANASHLQLDERPYSSSEGTVFLNTNNKRYAHSIRCIKD